MIPVNVIDLIEKIKSPAINQNEKMNYIFRVEAIRDYCDSELNKINNNIFGNFKKDGRKK
jgi:hypothetical protein